MIYCQVPDLFLCSCPLSVFGIGIVCVAVDPALGCFQVVSEMSALVKYRQVQYQNRKHTQKLLFWPFNPEKD